MLIMRGRDDVDTPLLETNVIHMMYVQGAEVQEIHISRIMMVWLWHEADCVTAVNFTLPINCANPWKAVCSCYKLCTNQTCIHACVCFTVAKVFV
jgi:hypothetical protein